MKSRRLVRVAVSVIALAAVLAFVLVGCPSYRDGMSGQLFRAKVDTVSAARSAVLAIQLWAGHRSTEDLTCVQLSDARDEVVKAYEDVASLKAQNPVDLARQVMLTESMADVVNALNDANASVRAVPGRPTARSLAQHLAQSADALERNYH